MEIHPKNVEIHSHLVRRHEYHSSSVSILSHFPFYSDIILLLLRIQSFTSYEMRCGWSQSIIIQYIIIFRIQLFVDLLWSTYSILIQFIVYYSQGYIQYKRKSIIIVLYMNLYMK